MLRIGRLLLVVALLGVAGATPCAGQRIHFPAGGSGGAASSAAAGASGPSTRAYPAAMPASPGPSVYTPPPAASPPAAAPFSAAPYGSSPYGTPPYSPSAIPPYSPPATPSYPPGNVPPYAPGAAPGLGPDYLPPPSAAFQGNVQPPAAWDPYATPGSASPGLLPQDPYMSWPTAPSGYIETARRFLEQIRLDYVWMPRNSRDQLGLNEVDLSASFAFPLRSLETPLFVTPGFAVHYLDGPLGPDADPDSTFNMPPRVYDAYLDAAWNPRFNETFGAELNFRTGVYSDFRRVTTDSLRFMGKGLAVIGFSPSLQFKAGAMYLDRQRVRLLPAGGVVWTPNPDMKFEFLFPDPRIAMRLTTIGNTDWWGYLRGEYGGGSWTVKEPEPFPPGPYRRDYNDIRVGAGLEFERLKSMRGLFEVGVAFDREIYGEGPVFHGRLKSFDPTVYLRSGLAY